MPEGESKKGQARSDEGVMQAEQEAVRKEERELISREREIARYECDNSEDDQCECDDREEEHQVKITINEEEKHVLGRMAFEINRKEEKLHRFEQGLHQHEVEVYCTEQRVDNQSRSERESWLKERQLELKNRRSDLDRRKKEVEVRNKEVKQKKDCVNTATDIRKQLERRCWEVERRKGELLRRKREIKHREEGAKRWRDQNQDGAAIANDSGNPVTTDEIPNYTGKLPLQANKLSSGAPKKVFLKAGGKRLHKGRKLKSTKLQNRSSIITHDSKAQIDNLETTVECMQSKVMSREREVGNCEIEIAKKEMQIVKSERDAICFEEASTKLEMDMIRFKDKINRCMLESIVQKEKRMHCLEREVHRREAEVRRIEQRVLDIESNHVARCVTTLEKKSMMSEDSEASRDQNVTGDEQISDDYLCRRRFAALNKESELRRRLTEVRGRKSWLDERRVQAEFRQSEVQRRSEEVMVRNAEIQKRGKDSVSNDEENIRKQLERRSREVERRKHEVLRRKDEVQRREEEAKCRENELQKRENEVRSTLRWALSTVLAIMTTMLPKYTDTLHTEGKQVHFFWFMCIGVGTFSLMAFFGFVCIFFCRLNFCQIERNRASFRWALLSVIGVLLAMLKERFEDEYCDVYFYVFYSFAFISCVMGVIGLWCDFCTPPRRPRAYRFVTHDDDDETATWEEINSRSYIEWYKTNAEVRDTLRWLCVIALSLMMGALLTYVDYCEGPHSEELPRVALLSSLILSCVLGLAGLKADLV